MDDFAVGQFCQKRCSEEKILLNRMSVLAVFLHTRCDHNEDAYTAISEINAEFDRFCRELEVRNPIRNVTAMALALTRAGFKSIYKRGIRMRKGLSIKKPALLVRRDAQFTTSGFKCELRKNELVAPGDRRYKWLLERPELYFRV